MKKISLLKGLALLGAVGLTSVCVAETVILLRDTKNNDEMIDISVFNNYHIDALFDKIPQETELLNLIHNVGIISDSGNSNQKFNDINDLTIVTGSLQNNSFILASRPNSTQYIADKTATIYFAFNTPNNLSGIISSNVNLTLDKYESDEITKSYILKNLQTQYIGLNINHLNVTNITHYGDETLNSATIEAKNNSILYTGAVNVTYYTSGAAVLTYAKTTLVPGDNNVLPTFTFKGVSAAPQYTCTQTPVSPITFTYSSGAFSYATGAKFNGGLYQVKASYTPIAEGPTYITFTNIFAAVSDPNTYRVTEYLSVSPGTWYVSFTPADNGKGTTIDVSSMGSSTAARYASFLLYANSPAVSQNNLTVKEGNGTMFYWWDDSNKKLWVRTQVDSSSPIITVTYDSGISHTAPTATAPVGWLANVAIPIENKIITMEADQIGSGWTLTTLPYKVGKIVELPYTYATSSSILNYGTYYSFILDAGYIPYGSSVVIHGCYKTGTIWVDMGLITLGADGKICFYGFTTFAAATTFRLSGTWIVA